jgi:integrase
MSDGLVTPSAFGPHLHKKAHGRPWIPPGRHGEIRVRAVVNRREIPEGQPVPKGATWRAVVNVRLLTGDLVRVEASGRSKTATQNAFTARCRTLLGPTAGKLTNRSTFADAAQAYLRWLDGEVTKGEKAPTTADRYRGVLQRHVLPTLGNLELHEVNVGVIEDMLDIVAAQGIGAPTRRHIRIVVRDILHIAVRRGALPANPARELQRIRSAGRSLPRALTPEERDHLLAALRADTYAVRSSITDLVVFMLGTGCWISEALAVRWRDVDLVGADVKGSSVPVVSLGPVVVTVKGQGLVYRPKGKTGKNEHDCRLVPLPPFTVDMLMSRRPTWATPDDPVFWSQARGFRASHNVHRTWRVTRARHGYDRVTSHVFRTTAISEWKRMGLVDLHIVGLAGHAKVSMTQDVYCDRNRLHPEAAHRQGC